MQHKIWVLSELYFPEQTSTGYIITRIAEALAEEFDVSVITGPPTNFFKPENAPKYEKRNNVTIFRCQGTSFDKDSLLGRVVNLITRSAAIFWKAFFNCRKNEVILVVTNPPLLPFVALLIKCLKGCKFVLLIHDVYPEILVATSIIKPSSFIFKIGQIINCILYTQASIIITIGRDMTKLVQDKLGEKKLEKIYYIPNWADIDIVYPTDRNNNTLLKKLGLTNKFVVLYAGNIGRTHGIEDLVKVAEILKFKCNNIYFLIIGFGAKKEWLIKYVNKKDIINIIISDCFSRNKQIINLNAGDVALISFVANMAGISVPSRMYNQMAAGKPIIAVTDDWSELAKVVKEENIGWVVQPGDIEGLVKTIEFAAEHPDLLAEMGARAAKVAQTKYTFAQTKQAYQQLFKEIFNFQQKG